MVRRDRADGRAGGAKDGPMTRENRTYEELRVGDTASVDRLCREDDFYVFAHASGNHNPMHLPDEDGDGDGRPEAIAPAMWIGSLISAVLGNVLPGPGTLYKSQTFRFLGRAHAGDTLHVSVTVLRKEPDGVVVFDTRVTLADGTPIAQGEAEVIAPARKLRFEDGHIPGLTVQRHAHFDALLKRAEPLDPMPCAVVAPESRDALEGALLAMRRTLIAPVLVGDEARIRAVAAELDEDLSGIEIVHAGAPAEAAARAVALVREGRAQALMKGHLHTDDLLRAVVDRSAGLRTARRLSHVFVMDVPGYDRLIMVTDAAINIAPDLAEKRDIVQNAIDLALALGVETPRVAVLSAVETVNPKMNSTIDAAALSKMADRGQIVGGLVDGPLAMDNAINLEAAQGKGIGGRVAGLADVLVAPNIEAANMMAKELTFLAHATAGGVVMGASAPIVLTSRADDEMSRLASCAIAVLFARASRKD